jgi:hypothetical protein
MLYLGSANLVASADADTLVYLGLSDPLRIRPTSDGGYGILWTEYDWYGNGTLDNGSAVQKIFQYDGYGIEVSKLSHSMNGNFDFKYWRDFALTIEGKVVIASSKQTQDAWKNDVFLDIVESRNSSFVIASSNFTTSFADIVSSSSGDILVLFDRERAGVSGTFLTAVSTASWTERSSPAGVAAVAAGRQYGEALVELADGRFVATWTDFGGRTPSGVTDGSGSGVKARIFGANYIAEGPDFLVNTTVAGEQRWPNVTALEGGGFVIVWRELANSAASSPSAVRGQVYDVSGLKIGGEITFAEAASIRGEARVAALSGGGFAVSWIDESEYKLLVREYDYSSKSVGDAITINTYGKSALEHDITTLSDGSVGIVWAEAVFLPNKIVDPSSYDVRVIELSAKPANVALAGGSLITELAHLADEAYSDSTSAAVQRGWRPISAAELGLQPTESSTWHFENGVFSQRTFVTWITEGDVSAHVLSGYVNGKKTLSIVFKGSDDVYDIVDDVYHNIGVAFSGYAVLTDALISFLTNASDEYDQVLVSGHSLGGGFSQQFIKALHDADSRIDVKGITLGTTGAESITTSASFSRLLNFIHADDYLVRDLHAIYGDVVGGWTTGIAAEHPDVPGWTPVPHTMAAYLTSVAKLVDFASDRNSTLFYESEFASALRSDQIEEVFSDYKVAVGSRYRDDVTINASAFNVDHVVLGDGDDIARIHASGADNRILKVDGGLGYDLADFTPSSSGVWVDIAQKTIKLSDEIAMMISDFESIVGSSYNDILIGSSRDERLSGGDGNDVISGGGGNDTLTGNGGTDLYYLASGDLQAGVRETVTDYATGETIRFGAVNSTSVSASLVGGDRLLTIAVSGGNAEIVVKGNGVLTTVFGTEPASLTTDLASNYANVTTKAFDLANANAWLTDTRVYDALQRLDTVDILNDDGTRVFTDFDQANTRTDTSTQTIYDNLGRMDIVDVRNDNGTRIFTDFDQAGTRADVLTLTAYDDLGRMDYVDVRNDTGTRIFTDFDQGNRRVDTSTLSAYDNLSRIDYVDVRNDNGARIFTDFDQANARADALTLTAYDNLSRIDYVDVRNDDGARVFTDFDQAGARADASTRTLYDTLGRVDIVDVLNDDGTRVFTDFDQANANATASTRTVYDTLKRIDYIDIIRDNGTRQFTDLDQAGVYSWSSTRTEYAANGSVISVTTIPD